MSTRPFSGTKPRLMLLPNSSRAGMFWRFGSEDESRPVATTVWLYEVWILPVFGEMSFGSASM